MNKSLTVDSYLEFVDLLAKTKQNKVFLNSGPTHAAIVMSRIFKYSKNIVRIFCGGFVGDVPNDESYLSTLQSFLTNGGTVKILVEKNLSASAGKVFKLLNNFPRQVELKTASSAIVVGEEKNPIHFTIGDDSLLRLETDVQDFSALVNFGDKETATLYIDLFDTIFKNSPKLNIAA